MDISKSITLFGKKALSFAKNNSSKLLAGGAIFFGLGTVALTWVAARKTDEALKKPKEIIEKAKERPVTEVYTEEDKKKDILTGYKLGAARMAKLYAGPVITGLASAGCVFGLYKSNENLKNVNAGLAAANSILFKELESIGKNVTEKYGAEENLKLRYSDKMEEKEKTVTDENGTEKKVKVKLPKKDYDLSTFSRCFCEDNPNWTKSPIYNEMFLRTAMADLNEMGRSRKDHTLWLNDVYERLGWEKTRAGYRNGWIFDPADPYKTYVDFGIYDTSKDGVRRFLFEGESSIWLTFNCRPIDPSDIPIPEV